ncbi:ATP-dependent 6-phosphofructokinase [Candidatus Phytoplasma melaleucae]|uniref:6-phosphofructokinase n=1 Tax=Candidatus Phytoplasma melaleucae TaxID=2982630 RepID=A0ABT9DCR1_9MOLU|nr:ATP-dependent 6-phosphofructokinase ['Melaleuca sp.' phytoplasma]MDO8167900.1 6-phosphofructokinase ['Melaleuca sp.' phytoplasma]MDV3205193.1 ATP-dependent 6-phosphofructokinase [Weeping tea tree witches'-broom phytoplasma]
MKNKKKEANNIAILTSGGDAPGMNAAIRAVFLTAFNKGFTVYGIKDGYLGLYRNQIELLTQKHFERVMNLSGTLLGTSRFVVFKEDENIRQICVDNLKKMNITKIIIIGGDGSYRGAIELTKLGIQCIGIPATIDNDIKDTDFTIGFSTALNNIVLAIEKLRDTSISHNRCSIIEVMGKYTGDLALYGGIATGADLIITHENILDKQRLLDKIKYFYNTNKRHLIIVITEHIFNVYQLAQEIEKYSGFESRAQILGHLQRGGTPTAEDLILASKMGNYAVNLLEQNIFNCAIGVHGLKLNYTSFESVFNFSSTPNELFQLLNYLS